jgi:hypothetical protein
MGRSRGTAVPRRQLLRVLGVAATSLTVGFWRAAGVVVDQNIASWNHVATWLHRLAALRGVAS